MQLLLLRLEGPLQSWGERSSWDTRDTALIPSKSGIIGLIACCMGIKRGDLKIREMSQNLHVAIRVDKPGIVMTDYQTVQGMPIIYGSNGKPRVSGNTIVTPRDYLQDASFLVAIYGEKGLLEECNKSLLEPVWTPYLGRKNCTPSKPVYPVLTDQFQTVDEAFELLDASGGNNRMVEAEYEDNNGEIVRPDSVISFESREFQSRSVKRKNVFIKGGIHVPYAS